MFDKIKSLFLVEDEAEKKGAEESNVKKKDKGTKNPQSSVSNLARPKTSAQHQKQFDDILVDALVKNNEKGYDYFEYRASLASLSKMNMDEMTRYKSAFALAQTMGASPKSLVDSALFYQEILQKENATFERTLKFQSDKQIKSKNALLVQYKEEIAKNEKLILALNKKIENLKNETDKVSKQIGLADGKITQTKESFELSYYKAYQGIQDDITKMKQFLK